MHAPLSNLHPIVKYTLGTCALISVKLTSYLSLLQPQHVTESHPLQEISHQSAGEQSERIQKSMKNLKLVFKISDIVAQPPPSSPRFPATVIPSLPSHRHPLASQATVTPSIQPIIRLRSTRLPFTSTNNTLPATWSSSTFSSCPSNLNTNNSIHFTVQINEQ